MVTGTALALLLASASPERVLVLDVAGEVLTKSEAALVRDALATRLQHNRGAKVEVLTTEDLRRVLDVEAEKQAAGCDTGTDACLAEIANALGASRVLHASVAKLGDEYVLSTALVDPKSARAVGRTSVRASSVQELVERANDAVDELRPPPRAPVITVVGAVTTAVGALVAAGSGAALGYLYSVTQDPRGDPRLKQAFLDDVAPLTIATIAGGGVLLVGVTVLCIGIVVE